MEIFLMTRGMSREVEEWAKWMQTRSLPIEMKLADGTKTAQIMECQLRPIQLWGFAFPKENLDMVLNTLGLPRGNPSGFVDGKPTFKNYEKNLWLLRKALGAKPIPEPVKKDSKLFMPYNIWKNLNIIGIGIKEDGEIAPVTLERI